MSPMNLSSTDGAALEIILKSYWTFQGGFYFFHLLDKYAAGYSILIAVLFESIAVSWIYGELIQVLHLAARFH